MFFYCSRRNTQLVIDNMKKASHIAVVLRGHVRTWHYIYPLVFKFYESIAGNVDYYFITWDNSNTKGIEETFDGKNLIKFIIVPHTLLNKKFYSSFLGPAWLGQHAISYINNRELELKKEYDLIVDTRPDVLCNIKLVNNQFNNMEYKISPLDEKLDIILPGLNSLHISGIELHKTVGRDYDIAIQDWFMMASSEIYKNLLCRYECEDGHLFSQIYLREFIEDLGINICIINWIDTIMVRPNVFKLDWKYSKDYDSMAHISRDWPNLSAEEKTNLCLEYDIELADYTTNSITCCIDTDTVSGLVQPPLKVFTD